MKLLILIIVVLVLLIGGCYLYYGHIWQYQGEEAVYHIKKGMGCSQFVQGLNDERILSMPASWFLEGYLRTYKLDKLIKAGMLDIKIGYSLSELAEAAIHSVRTQRLVFTPHESDEYSLGKRLEELGICSQSSFVEFVHRNFHEGYLFPLTGFSPVGYWFARNTEPKEIVRVMKEEFFAQCGDLFQDYLGATKPSSEELHEVVIKASIVQMELLVSSEAHMIACVIENRLRKGWMLQMDATTEYGLGRAGKGSRKSGQLRRKDLGFSSLWNTHVVDGLPLTAICSPSRSALHAVLRVVSEGVPSKYKKLLYFMSKYDGSGEHYFATNHRDHLKNIARSKKNRAKLKRNN